MKKYPNVIAARTFSKIYGLAGLRIGYGMASPKIVDILNRLREPFNVNSIAQVAAVAALSDEKYYRTILQETQKQKQYLETALKAMGVETHQSATNFILVHVVKDSTQIAQALLKKGLIVRDMAAWGLKGYIRVSVGKPSENKQFIKILQEIL
jgi:histidinol-phosphate aminotransferase